VSTATIVVPLMATAPGEMTRRAASIVITVPPVTTSVARRFAGGAAPIEATDRTSARTTTVGRRAARSG